MCEQAAPFVLRSEMQVCARVYSAPCSMRTQVICVRVCVRLCLFVAKFCAGSARLEWQANAMASADAKMAHISATVKPGWQDGARCKQVTE